SSREYDARRVLVRMAELFHGLERDVDLEQCYGTHQATREGILGTIDGWIARAEEHDSCVLYYFGHGGRVHFFAAPVELSIHAVPYLSCEPNGPGFTGILDYDLSTRMAALDRRCGNVTTIIDACYSASMVRERNDNAAVPRATVLETSAP